MKTLKSSLQTLTAEVHQCHKTIGKLTEEVIAVKLENRMHHKSTSFKQNTKFDKLPFLLMVDLITFNEELEKNEELLDEFVCTWEYCLPYFTLIIFMF